MSATWSIDCDGPMLEMMAFAVETMGQMLREEVGKKKGKAALQLVEDVGTANRILSELYSAQVNLEMAKATSTRVKVRRPSKKAGPGNTANKKARR